MYQQYKVDEIKKIKQKLENHKSIVLVNYRGINIEEVDELRTRLRDNKVDYFVSKNTFIKVALKELGISGLDDELVGPTAVAVSSNDEVAPARELAKFMNEVMKEKDFPSFKIGMVDGSVVDVEGLEQLAKLPSKQQLISMVLQGFNAPINGFVGTLNGIITKFVRTVDAVAKKQAEKN